MFTMYDTIMDLPLFKGISFEHVSAFVEKTNIEFINLEAGEEIFSEGEECKYLIFIIKGKVELLENISDLDCRISQIVGKETVLGADKLFGMYTSYSNNAVANTKVSLLRINKLQYVDLLLSNSIYLYNFINYLSFKSQQSIMDLKRRRPTSLLELMRIWVTNFCESFSKNILIQLNEEEILKSLNTTKEEFYRDLHKLKKERIINFSDAGIIIPDRKQFLKMISKNK